MQHLPNALPMAYTCTSNIMSKSDFTTLPAPPATYTAELQWNHRNWDKLGEGQYVYAREVRESFLDCLGVWSTLNEDFNVPKLLDHATFIKYCYYYMTMEEFHSPGGDFPDDYIPMDYEKDEDSKEQWKRRKLAERYNEQYCERSRWEMMTASLFGDESKKEAKPDVQSKENQFYIRAVKTNCPDAIKALFAKGTSALCPNCLEKFDDGPSMRRGVVAYAIENLYDDSKSRSDALECLRLVCSLKGVDVNADTWYTPFRVGPPLWTALNNWDADAMQILLNAGARTSYPDVVGIQGQWCALRKPVEYPEKYGAALHCCVYAVDMDTKDEELSEVLKILLDGREADTLVKGEVEDHPSGLTALEMLTSFVEEMKKLCEEDGQPPLEFPISIAVLRNAQAKVAGIMDEKKNGAGYKAILLSAELDSNTWATIGDLDSAMQMAVSQYTDIYDWVSVQVSTIVAKTSASIS